MQLTTQTDLDTEDFAQLTAPLLYEMFKAHTQYPLHLAIQHKREDVVFLFLIEYNLQVCICHCVMGFLLLNIIANKLVFIFTIWQCLLRIFIIEDIYILYVHVDILLFSICDQI